MQVMAGACMASVPLWVNVVFLVVSRDAKVPEPGAALTALFGLQVGLIPAIAMYLLHARMLAFARKVGASYFIVFLLSFVAFWWLSVCGLVGTFITKKFWWAAACGLLALAAMALRFPRSASYEQFLTSQPR